MSPRIVSADVAKSLRAMARTGGMLSARENVITLANTVVHQDEQIAAVLALHRRNDQGPRSSAICNGCTNERWPCPTVRALGVTENP